MVEWRGIEWRLRARLAGDARGNRGGTRFLQGFQTAIHPVVDTRALCARGGSSFNGRQATVHHGRRE